MCVSVILCVSCKQMTPSVAASGAVPRRHPPAAGVSSAVACRNLCPIGLSAAKTDVRVRTRRGRPFYVLFLIACPAFVLRSCSL
jgi:hypothetical protein